MQGGDELHRQYVVLLCGALIALTEMLPLIIDLYQH